jgi:stage II sporulation protein P
MKIHKIFFVLIALIFLLPNVFVAKKCFADTEDGSTRIFLIYDELDNVLFEINKVEVGDIFITKDLKQYEVYEVDEENFSAYAEYSGYYIKPKITIEENKENLKLQTNIAKSVGLYMTHNDESFVPTDGVSSIYGAGGIHDVAKALKQAYEDLNYTVYLDETLHLPHDSSAYSRSYSTAYALLEKGVDALFDIHRDGVSRSVYVKTIDGVERCKVRIVVGQANENKDANLQFAMYLVSIAEEYCPWLFLDIYMAKGHYNQALSSKALLFEMGTYLAEKNLVIDSTPYLAGIVDKTLFSTVVQDDNSLVVTDDVSEEDEENLVTNVLENETTSQTFYDKYSANITAFVVILLIILTFVVISAVKRAKKKKSFELNKKDSPP